MSTWQNSSNEVTSSEEKSRRFNFKVREYASADIRTDMIIKK